MTAPTVPYFKSGWDTDLEFTKEIWGVSFKSKNHCVVFGNKQFSFDNMKASFRNCSFHRLKQTHSDILEKASNETQIENPTVGPSAVHGDAIFTDEANSALGVSTADCLPVAIVNPKFCLGIHAGWKGIQSEIISKSLVKLKNEGFDLDKTEIFIGPHILRSSFEVDLSLADQFQDKYNEYLETCPSAERGFFQESIVTTFAQKPGKAFVDLFNIARVQLCIAGIRFQRIHFYLQDTKTSPHWASYRREGANMGKNLAFVARLNP